VQVPLPPPSVNKCQVLKGCDPLTGFKIEDREVPKSNACIKFECKPDVGIVNTTTTCRTDDKCNTYACDAEKGCVAVRVQQSMHSKIMSSDYQCWMYAVERTSVCMFLNLLHCSLLQTPIPAPKINKCQVLKGCDAATGFKIEDVEVRKSNACVKYASRRRAL
jgi:hypothetical protein